MNQKTNRKNPQDELCSAIGAGDLNKINQLLKAKTVPDPDTLLAAISENAHDILKALIKAGADVNGWKGGGIVYRIDTPVARALDVEDNVALKILLDAGASPNKDCAAGRPLLQATKEGSAGGAQLLIAAGADLEQRNSSEMTSLIVAASMGNVEMVRLLLQAGANPLSVDVLDRTAYDIAVERKEEDVAKILAPVSSGKIPRPKSPVELLLDAIKNQDAAAFDRCLADGVDVNKRDRWGRNPLDCAVDVGSVEFVRKLIKAGANVNAHKEGTALSMAVNNERPDIAEILVKSGAIPRAFSKYGTDPFRTVCLHGDVHLAKLFLEAGADPNTANNSGETALMNAVKKWGSVELVELLISKGAEVECADNDGQTALFHAVRSNPPFTVINQKLPSGARILAPVPKKVSEDERLNEIIKCLLANGANVNRRDNEGRTPLTYATTAGMARLLIGAGARMDIRDKRSHDAAYWLKKNKVKMDRKFSVGVQARTVQTPAKLKLGRFSTRKRRP